MRLPIETANLRRRANFDAHEIGQPVPGPIETLDSDEPWMDDHFTQENFEQLQDAQIDGELGPALDLTRQAMLKKWKFARFAEGDTAGFEKWLKTQPKAVQDDWESNKEKYGDQFSKKARFAEGDTAGFEKWLKTQPKSVQDDWESNKEKYGDQFSKKAHRRNASGVDSNPYLDPKVKAAVMAFEEALDELIRKEGTLCRVASSSLNELLGKFIEEKRKFVMMGNHPDDFSDTPQGSRVIQAREYLEEITAACESISSLQRLISFMDSRDRY
jgi:hypothetical protein